MIGTHLTADLIGRLEDDFKFKRENIKHLIDGLFLQMERNYCMTEEYLHLRLKF